MRYFLRVIAIWAWAIWFGGLVGMFFFITGLFHFLTDHNMRPIFDEVAPHQFAIAQRSEIIFGMIALVATFGLWVLERRAAIGWLLTMLVVAAALVVLNARFITPHMVDAFVPHAEPSTEFKRWHGMSMLASTIEAALLLIGGAALPGVFKPTATEPRPSEAA
jgi:uncharacterized membrane protein